MDKSQLRRLALDFADGDIPASEYRVQRRALIDGIVDGYLLIEREPPSVAIPRDLNTGPINVPASAKPALPWVLVLGAASAVCVAIVAALLLWPADDPPQPPPASSPSVPTAGLSPARALVESFVARRNFASDALDDFETRWTALTQAERDEARGSLWFASLGRALRDEMKTQNALAGLAGGEPARARAERIATLGENLGISGQLPDLEAAQTSTLAPTVDSLPPAAAGQQARTAPSVAPSAAPPSPAIQPPASTPPSPADRSLTGRQWLARHEDTKLTLQLFAVNALDRVEQLIAAHPDLSVRILATDGATPRFRVFHGVFADEATARSAFDALPVDIISASGGAIVKSIAAVRDDLAGRSAAPAAPVARPAPDADDGSYTLQLFASGNRDNAESLVKAFPDLPLQLRELDGDAAPFRVVYGRFDSADSARAAGSGLPATLLTRIGKPLARPVAETGNSLNP